MPAVDALPPRLEDPPRQERPRSTTPDPSDPEWIRLAKSATSTHLQIPALGSDPEAAARWTLDDITKPPAPDRKTAKAAKLPAVQPAPVAWIPSNAPLLVGLGALAGFVGAPAVASATEIAPLPAQLGTWGIVAYALVKVVQELLTWRREQLAERGAREEATRLRAEVVRLTARVEQLDEARDAALARAVSAEARLEERGRR